MYSADQSNFKAYIKKLPQQIHEARQIFSDTPLVLDQSKIKNIIYLGMGGSAIAGDILHDIFFNQLPVPFHIVRDYTIPAYCTASTLVIASSYSGNTEETLAALDEARSKGCQIITITSGGELLTLANQYKWPYIKIPPGFPPRQAFGYSFFSLLYLFNSLNYISVSDHELQAVRLLAKSIVERNDDQVLTGKILMKDLASKIHKKIPIIYASAPCFSSIATRWKNQFQENSKIQAFANTIPEMNHNEIVGWEMSLADIDNLIVIFLEAPSSNKRINIRINLTKKIIKDKGIELIEIYAEGSTPLQQAISFVAKGDWVSYYLALLNNKDPMAIVNIDYLKAELKKHT
jgi:glucose/mannose-6-phosphate isomerase